MLHTNIKKSAKRIAAAAAAAALCLGISSETFKSGTISAKADKAAYEQAIEEYQNNLGDLKARQEGIDSQLDEIEQDKIEEQENQNLIEEQISLVEQTLLTLDNSIKELDGKIAQLEIDIADTQSRIADQQTQIEDGVEAFKLRLRAMYLAGSESYTDIILGSEDFFDMLMKLELVKRVANHDNDMITNLIELKDAYKASLSSLEAQSEEYEANQQELISQQESQTEQKGKLEHLYSQSVAAQKQLEMDAQNYKDKADEINKEQQNAEDIIAQLYASLEAINNRTSTNNEDYGYVDSSMFTWPCPGFYHITYGYGPRWGTVHKGIDISSSGIQGASIIAAADGTVILKSQTCPHNYAKSDSCGCGGGYGNYVIIDHGDGIWTLYGHMQDIYINEGDFVEKGTVLGEVGSTGHSTGFHVHFEIRFDNVAVDPQDYV